MIGTIVVGAILVCIVSAIIFSMVKTKRAGGHLISCGGNCGGCSGACHCKNNEKTSAETPYFTQDKPLKF